MPGNGVRVLFAQGLELIAGGRSEVPGGDLFRDLGRAFAGFVVARWAFPTLRTICATAVRIASALRGAASAIRWTTTALGRTTTSIGGTTT
ncbi:MAG TPA: hypothetical protein DCO91_02105, partial [Microbacterium sp.]|nr:hypothetical protein [Microbacterium sp.]HCU77126.1 hypothetical protein [Microbacterium sp.]